MQFLADVLLSTPILAAFVEQYIERISASAGVQDDPDSEPFSSAQFFLFHLGSLFARDGDLAKETAKKLFARVVHAALRIREFDTYKYLRDPRIPENYLEAELAETRAHRKSLAHILPFSSDFRSR